ncbi:hypothetical protein L3Q82_005357 [Scortum barcoo]|uniref:Uncharacterized protein n=1 Tax=Scortum barcoo TaxID=214431 RepID=A0ACB8VAL1_9TELE|nr:hypothetical protein L3Q82_005357 [Scortum barcoo]
MTSRHKGKSRGEAKEERTVVAECSEGRQVFMLGRNGGQSSEEDSLQVTGDADWNHYKPSTGANSMKRHRENCNSPASVQGLYDQASYMMNGELMNGELKHALNEQSLLVHQSKKLKTEIKLNKRNCNFTNGDIFSLSRNKQVLIPNGAVSPSSTIESTPGMPNSTQMPDSQQQQAGASGNVQGGNNYNYVVNGYSNNFEADHQQQQHQQQPQSYSDQELSLGIYVKTNQEFNQNTLLEHNAPLQAAEAGGYGSFPNSGIRKTGQNEEPSSGQHQQHGPNRGQQYGIQPQTLKQNSGNPHGADSTISMGPSLQQPRHAGNQQVASQPRHKNRTCGGASLLSLSQSSRQLTPRFTARCWSQIQPKDSRHREFSQIAARGLAASSSNSKTVYQPKHIVLQPSTILPLSGSNQILKHHKYSNLYPRKCLSSITSPKISRQTAATIPRCSQSTYVKTLTCRIYYHLSFYQHNNSSNHSTVIFNVPCPILHNLKGSNSSLPITDLAASLSQRPNNHCHQSNNADISQTSTQSQPHLPQDPHGDFQRHAALRMHLLQRQERQGPPHLPQSIGEPKHGLRAVKMENGPRFELSSSQQQEQQLQMREAGIGGMQVKQENQQSLCEQSKRQGSILASMEQSLRQYQPSPVFEKKSLVINSSNKVKLESSGPVTILSTNTDLSGVESSAPASANVALKKPPDSTPKKEHLLQSFMDSPMKLLDTPIKNLLDTPMKTQYDIASCHCVEQISEKDEGPYYTHLGAGPTVASIREAMEKRSGLTGHAIRIEKVIYTGKEGKSTQGCPIAKWVIRRSSVEEKLLVLVRERAGHTCETACIIVVILVWEGILPSLADRLYLELSETLRKHGALTQRRCALNEERTCACQGLEADACGASFSFGCSWSMYYNGCKFARSKVPRKFKLLGDDVKEEEKVENNFQNLATLLAPLYKKMAPEAYGNQVCTLTREDNREIGKIPEDEQLHVLPLYKASNTDEFGSEEGQQEKIKSGAIQVLSAFRRQVRMLAEPAKSCRQKKLDAKKAAANKTAMLDSSNDKAEKALLAKSKAGSYENTVQSTPMSGLIPGAMGASLQSGHPPQAPGAHHQQLQQQQHQGILPPYPGSTNAASYPTFPNHPGSFPSTSKPGSMYPPQPQTPATPPYPAPLHVPNSYINGSNRPYPGYQCNGGMPLENYHPYYASNPKHLDMYRQQRPALYSEQQYGVHQRYEVNYPPRYGEPGLQVNGYNARSMRQVHPMRPYTPYGPNGASDPQFMDALSRAPSAHGGLDYPATVSKGNQFGGYPSPYLSRSPQILPTGQDPFHMQIKTEMGMPRPQMLSAQLSGGCLNPEIQSGLGLPNGSLMGSTIKQEPGTPQPPTTPQKPEMWSDNEHNFLDPDIGGVAVAPSHGSVLIECAKRELHATTPLKNPDRNHPTRISLVFYQHKNMNEAKHGLAMWEAKMAEKAREKEEDAERNGGEGTPSKGNKKGVKRELPDSSESTGEPPYKRFIQALMEGSLSCTTNTYVSTSPYAFTKVTGPYSQFV